MAKEDKVWTGFAELIEKKEEKKRKLQVKVLTMQNLSRFSLMKLQMEMTKRSSTKGKRKESKHGEEAGSHEENASSSHGCW
ncbi:MAG: hypothetical protein CM15mV9_0230 [uncultured marine virus]|nr:MAG: hypothetical protein CM15mV9_0230 [uncultured marine virus]